VHLIATIPREKSYLVSACGTVVVLNNLSPAKNVLFHIYDGGFLPALKGLEA
jgi:hypothetical protein